MAGKKVTFSKSSTLSGSYSSLTMHFVGDFFGVFIFGLPRGRPGPLPRERPGGLPLPRPLLLRYLPGRYKACLPFLYYALTKVMTS